MPPAAIALVSASNRSRVTNGTELLAGIDGRNPRARRYRDIIELLSADLGELTDAEHLLVRNAASMQLHAEELTAALVRGEKIDPEEFTRAANGATRALQGLRRRKAATKPPRSGVAGYLNRQAEGV